MSFEDAFGIVKGRAENVLARIPVLGPMLGAETDAHKNLVKKQEQMAEEAKKRMEANQRARMNSLGQQMLAFNPMNQVMAQMYGPEAAFQPEQLAAMAQNPMRPQADPSIVNYKGLDPRKQKEVEAFIAKKKAFDLEEARRREMLMGGLQAPGPGPTPIQMPTPQAARRY